VPRCAVEADDLTSTELDLVQVGSEEVLLCHRAVEGASVPDLGPLTFQFAQHVPLLEIMEHQILEELHGDRAAPATEPSAQDGRESDEVHSAVVHVAAVLDGDDRLLD